MVSVDRTVHLGIILQLVEAAKNVHPIAVHVNLKLIIVFLVLMGTLKIIHSKFPKLENFIAFFECFRQ